MSQDCASAPWIDTRLSAAIAVGYAGFLTARRTLFLLAHSDPRPHGIHAFDGVLPQFTWAALSVLVYGMVIARFVQVLRDFAGPDRVYCALFLCDLLLLPSRLFLPMPLPALVLWLEVLCNAIMFIAAIQIFITLTIFRKKQLPQPDS